MFDSGVLDVAVGLLVVFILVSTVCASIREAIETRLKTRAAYLEYAIRELLDDRRGEGLAKLFFQHPLIHGLYLGDYQPAETVKGRLPIFARGGDMPSYIPARNFAQALIDTVAHSSGADPSSARAVTPLSLRDMARRLESARVRTAMFSALDSSQGDMNQVREQLQSWFDATMDRVSGWYKRATQQIIFGIALVVVGALNVNAIAIADTLYRVPTTRAALVAGAEHGDFHGLQEEPTLHLPIGWTAAADAWDAKLKAGRLSTPLAKAYEVAMTGLGLLLTVFAATLGAPFWFDVLNRVMVIRATVKPHEKSPEEGSEDRQPTGAQVSSRVIQPVVYAPHPENDIDGCDLGDDDPTPDEALPAATGGVSK